MSEQKRKHSTLPKRFEHQVFEDLSKIDGVSIDRIPDQVTKYKGSSSNICDFLVYQKPTLLYLECKTVHGNTLPFSNIRENQWEGMLKKAQIDGVKAGIICWWIDHDQTWFIPIEIFVDAKMTMNAKSLNILKPHMQGYWTYIPGKKKRVLFDYDFSDFFEFITMEHKDLIDDVMRLF